MQLTSITGAVIANYYPIEGNSQFVYKVLKFHDVQKMSTKCITKKEFEYEKRERIGLGWVLTGFNTEPVKVNPMTGAC